MVIRFFTCLENTDEPNLPGQVQPMNNAVTPYLTISYSEKSFIEALHGFTVTDYNSTYIFSLINTIFIFKTNINNIFSFFSSCPAKEEEKNNIKRLVGYLSLFALSNYI
jgi:hypothetical protein